MIQDIFTRASVLAKLESGPLGSHLVDLIAALQQQRYATHTIQKYLHAADSFGRWLQTRQIALSTINEEVIAHYVSTLERRKVRSHPRGAPPRGRWPPASAPLAATAGHRRVASGDETGHPIRADPG